MVLEEEAGSQREYRHEEGNGEKSRGQGKSAVFRL
jgi:hypothetical protein